VGIFNPTLFDEYGISIVGCGGVGSALGIILAKLGMSNFELWDFDKIDLVNIPNQFFKENSIGKLKTEELKENMELFSKDLDIEIVNQKFTTKNVLTKPIVCCCVDSMKARKDIFEKAVKSKEAKLFIDTRMGGEIFEIFTIDLTNKDNIKYYKNNLFPDNEAASVRCTEKAIIFNVMTIASLVACQLIKVLKNVKYKRELTGDLITVNIK